MAKNDSMTFERVQNQHDNLVTLQESANSTILSVNKLIVQGHEQQNQIYFLMEKSQMVDRTEGPEVRSEPITDPITITTTLGPVVHTPREPMPFEASTSGT